MDITKKTFSSKSNAKRGLVAAGLDPDAYTCALNADGDRWTVTPRATAPAPTPAPTPDTEDFTPLNFLKGGATDTPDPPAPVAAPAPATGWAHGDEANAILAAFETNGSGAHGDIDIRALMLACYTAGQALPSKRAARDPAKPRGPSKLGVISELLQRPEGATSKELLDATNWPSISVPASAKAAGLELRKEKVDGKTRYYGKAA